MKSTTDGACKCGCDAVCFGFSVGGASSLDSFSCKQVCKAAALKTVSQKSFPPQESNCSFSLSGCRREMLELNIFSSLKTCSHEFKLFLRNQKRDPLQTHRTVSRLSSSRNVTFLRRFLLHWWFYSLTC